MRVTALQGDSVDSLCYRHQGSSAGVEATLEANPGLAALGVIVPMGTVVTLPEVSSLSSASTSQTVIQLWD